MANGNVPKAAAPVIICEMNCPLQIVEGRCSPFPSTPHLAVWGGRCQIAFRPPYSRT